MTPPILSSGKVWLLAGLASCLLLFPGLPASGEEENLLPALAALDPVLLLPGEGLAVVRSGDEKGESPEGLRVLRVGDFLLEGKALVERIEEERLVLRVPAVDGGIQAWLEPGAAPADRLRLVRQRGPSGGGAAIVAIQPLAEAEKTTGDPAADAEPGASPAEKKPSAASYPGEDPE